MHLRSFLQQLRLKMGILRLCATKRICVTLRDPKKMFCSFAPQKGMLRPLRLKTDTLQLCATEATCATLHDPKKVCCVQCGSKKGTLRICSTEKKTYWDFGHLIIIMLRLAQPQCFARLCATRVEVCNRCFDRLDTGSICFD